MVDFTDGPAGAGFFSPERFEADVYDCEVEGTIPEEIDGAFVRVGGSWFYPGKNGDTNPFSPEGYISSFRIKNGIVDYKGRWVKTPRFLNNLAERRQLYGKYRNPTTNDSAYQNLDKPYLGTVMNTAPIAHGGKLFALKEDAHPYEIDPNTLETIGPWDFDGQYQSQTFTAHPKIDPVSGDMVTFGYEATGTLSNDIMITTINPEGRVIQEARLSAPYICAMHDFVITQEHIILPIFGYVTSEERIKAGQDHWGYDASAPAYWGILRRDSDGSDVRWFKGAPQSVIHTLNGHTEGNKVIVEAPISDGNPFPWVNAVDGSPWNPQKSGFSIRRLTFDLSSSGDSYQEEILFSGPFTDLARIDDRYISLPNRYIYSGISDNTKPFDSERAGTVGNNIMNSYFRFDLETSELKTFFAGDTHSVQEVSFIPRSATSAEGDGFLVGIANNYADMRSELVIVDAQAMEELARVYLPFRSTAQVHGRWFNASELPFSDDVIPPYTGRVQS